MGVHLSLPHSYFASALVELRDHIQPAALDIFTTRPLAFLINGRKVLVTSINPHIFTSADRLNSASGVHSIGDVHIRPALFTRPHNPAETKMKHKN